MEEISKTQAQDELRTWIEEMRGQGIRRFELRCQRPGSGLLKDWIWTADNDAGPVLEPVHVAEQAQRLAEQNGRYQPGDHCFFELRAFRPTQDTDCGHHLIVVCAAGKGRASEERTAADTAGALQQMSLMLRDLHKLFIQDADMRVKHYEKLVGQLMDRNESLESRRFDTIRLAENMLSQHAEREAERLAETRNREMQQHMVGKIDLLLPVVINRLAGGGPGKGRPYMGEEIVRRLLGSLSKDQLDGMIGDGSGLSDDQRVLFGELYMSYAAQFEKEQEAKRKRTPINGPPADPSANGHATQKE
jgi:hypothetical protein